MFVIVDKLLNGVECMLLDQVVQSFWSRLFDVVMLRHHIPTSIMSHNALFTLSTDAVTYSTDGSYHKHVAELSQRNRAAG